MGKYAASERLKLVIVMQRVSCGATEVSAATYNRHGLRKRRSWEEEGKAEAREAGCALEIRVCVCVCVCVYVCAHAHARAPGKGDECMGAAG